MMNTVDVDMTKSITLSNFSIRLYEILCYSTTTNRAQSTSANEMCHGLRLRNENSIMKENTVIK